MVVVPGSGSNQTVNTFFGGGREREGKKLAKNIFLVHKITILHCEAFKLNIALSCVTHVGLGLVNCILNW